MNKLLYTRTHPLLLLLLLLPTRCVRTPVHTCNRRNSKSAVAVGCKHSTDDCSQNCRCCKIFLLQQLLLLQWLLLLLHNAVQYACTHTAFDTFTVTLAADYPHVVVSFAVSAERFTAGILPVSVSTVSSPPFIISSTYHCTRSNSAYSWHTH
jgi:hypothetical protein